MASIIPEHILNTLLCSICKQYLSCGPIKIMKNQERLLCGRCTTIVPSSPSLLYEQVAIFSLFPCINRYEGCNALLKYQDIKQHEKTCLGTNYICPTCPNGDYKPNSLLYLVDHYKSKHIGCILDVPKFKVDPSEMSDISYLFCDTASNCLFIIDVICTQDHIFLNASVAGKRKVVQIFKVNDLLQDIDDSVICPSLMNQRSESPTFQFKTATLDKNSPIWCELLYEVENRTATVVATDIGYIKQPNLNTFRKLPKLYLDPEMFPGNKKHYKLSSCKSKLINTADSMFSVQLKCGCCKTYFWNVSDWRQPFPRGTNRRGHIRHPPRAYLPQTYLRQETYPLCRKVGLYILFRFKEQNFLVCSKCTIFFPDANRVDTTNYELNYFETISSSPIFHLRVYCRYDCAGMYPIWELYKHEKYCEFNLEKLSDEDYVKKCFDEDSYGTEARFVNGNIVESFQFTAAFYQNAIFGYEPRVQNCNDVISPEILIYVVTDDGQKCKLSCKYENGQVVVLATEYNKSKYQAEFLIGISSDDFEEHVGGFSMKVALNPPLAKSEGVCQIATVQRFILWMRQIAPEHILTV